MQPATLVDVLGPHSHEPVLPVPQVRTELHNHVCELIEVWPIAEILDRLVFEHADLVWGEPVHFYHLQRLSVELEWERKLF